MIIEAQLIAKSIVKGTYGDDSPHALRKLVGGVRVSDHKTYRRKTTG